MFPLTMTEDREGQLRRYTNLTAHNREELFAEISALRDSLQRTKDALASAKEIELQLRAEIRDEEKVHDAAFLKLQQQLAQSQEVARKLAGALRRLRDSVNADQSQLDKYSSFDAAYAASNGALAFYAAHRPAEPNGREPGGSE